MNKGYLVAAVALLLISLACITIAVAQAIGGTHGMGSLQFWASVAFHAATATVAAVLLHKSHRKTDESTTEAQP